MMKEETDKAIEFMDWMSDWFYSTIPDKKEYLEISQKIIDTKALLQEGGKANNKNFIDELEKIFINEDSLQYKKQRAKEKGCNNLTNDYIKGYRDCWKSLRNKISVKFKLD